MIMREVKIVPLSLSSGDTEKVMGIMNSERVHYGRIGYDKGCTLDLIAEV
jgi:hypothetical protein